MRQEQFTFRLGPNLMEWSVDCADPGEVDTIRTCLDIAWEHIRADFVPKFWRDLKGRSDLTRREVYAPIGDP